MRYAIVFVLAATLFLGCAGEPKETIQTEVSEKAASSVSDEKFDIETTREELRAFNSNRDKIAFLREITVDDQRVRTEEASIVQEHGFNSDEHEQSLKSLAKMDAINLAKVDAYTEIFGAPEKNSVGMMQAEATAYVVHHSTEVEVKRRYYKLLTDGYDNELVSGTMYTMYLNRWYELVSSERHTMEGRYTEVDEIKELRDLLKLN